MNAALARGKRSPAITREDLASIEEAMQTLGDYPGIIGEMLMRFRRSVQLLKAGIESGDDDSIQMASAYVCETWEVLAPALEKLTAARLKRSE